MAYFGVGNRIGIPIDISGKMSFNAGKSLKTHRFLSTSWDQNLDAYTGPIGFADYYNTVQPCLVTPGNEGTGDIVLMKTDYTKRADTGDTVALDGSQGQVMMRFPKFYYKYNFVSDEHTWQISRYNFTGFSLHPAFVKAGVEVPYRYIGVYEAAWYDVSAGAYVNGDGANSAFDISADKLGSIAGKKPLTNKTRVQLRAAAARVGTGWQLMDFNLYAALKMLYITRYSNLNSQSVVGAGNTRWSAWDFATRISATGKVLLITATGQSTAGGNASDYCNLFGIENLWGNVWEFVDGWNINNGISYVCTNIANFADDVGPTSDYVRYGSTNPTTSGWQSTLQQNIGMLPASVGATDLTRITDYYWYASGWRVPLIGGNADDGSGAGLCCLGANYSSSAALSYIGGRLCY